MSLRKALFLALFAAGAARADGSATTLFDSRPYVRNGGYQESPIYESFALTARGESDRDAWLQDLRVVARGWGRLTLGPPFDDRRTTGDVDSLFIEGRVLKRHLLLRVGRQLAVEHPTRTDLVMPVPDTGAPAAAGFAEASGIPYREGLVRNRYTGRTFIQPSQTLRHRGVTMKLNPLREVVRGKRLTVVDDSIVRGTTTRQIVQMLREAGATEVHLRVSSPPYRWPCFYGMDTGRRSELLAADLSVGEIRSYLGADSLAYLELPRLVAATGAAPTAFCNACLTGEYPVAIVEELAGEPNSEDGAPDITERAPA